MTMKEESRCFRGCCTSTSVPLDVAMSELTLANDSVIARGAMSRVKGGQYRGQDVAVKFPSLPTTDDLDRFHRELSLHLEFTQLGEEEGKHVVPVVAARAYPPHYVTIMPLARGNLQELVHRPVDAGSIADLGLPFREVVSVGLEIARGVKALHDRGYVHRDLKPANVLLSQNGVAQLCDFQLTETEAHLVELFSNPDARLNKAGKPSGGFHKKLLVGTLEYMAPEILTKSSNTRKSDVYSLAILLNECATGIFPYSDCHKERPGCHTVLEMGYGHQELKAAVATEGLRPTTLAHLEEAKEEREIGLFNGLLQRCWALDPRQRPGIDEVVAELETMLQGLGGGVPEPLSHHQE